MGLGSGTRDPKKHIPDPRVKKAPNPGSGSATLIAAAAKMIAQDRRKNFKIN